MKKLFLGLVLVLMVVACNQNPKAPEEVTENWIQLFNGKDLSDWTVKITGYPTGENFGNTFRVEDNILKVCYDQYDNAFDNRFGHIFYNKEFSDYKLRVEYRFIGDQLPDGEGWAYRNSGVMFHSQSPESMTLYQDFPVSIEAQLLGGDGMHERTTGNVCTPGTEIVIEGEVYPSHCAPSRSKTYHGDDWQTFEMLVYSDSIVHHIMEGDTILTYTTLTLSDEDGATESDLKPLKKGFIAVQSESTPIEFRKIELLDLSSDK